MKTNTELLMKETIELKPDEKQRRNAINGYKEDDKIKKELLKIMNQIRTGTHNIKTIFNIQ